MNNIRLVATFEVEFEHEDNGRPDRSPNRILSRAQCAALADALAQDLVRQAELASSGLLIVGGGLFEPAELLRPGLPAWAALDKFSENAPISTEDGGQILAIGAHEGKMPDSRLTPECATNGASNDSALGGQLLALPLVIRCPQAAHTILSEQLESTLFESGGLHPPARASFSEATGLATGHGQLMTLNDFIALTHVQMDTAGLGAFWPVVEHALVRGDENNSFEMPGPLSATWHADTETVTMAFQTYDDFTDSLENYALWMRAFRSLSALLALHGIRSEIQTSHTVDGQRQSLVETIGPVGSNSGLTEQVHPDCGLLCWTLIEDHSQFNLYPLNSKGVALLQADFAARGLTAKRPDDGVKLTAEGGSLQAVG